jgi:hypothetical protein
VVDVDSVRAPHGGVCVQAEGQQVVENRDKCSPPNPAKLYCFVLRLSVPQIIVPRCVQPNHRRDCQAICNSVDHEIESVHLLENVHVGIEREVGVALDSKDVFEFFDGAVFKALKFFVHFIHTLEVVEHVVCVGLFKFVLVVFEILLRVYEPVVSTVFGGVHSFFKLFEGSLFDVLSELVHGQRIQKLILVVFVVFVLFYYALPNLFVLEFL